MSDFAAASAADAGSQSAPKSAPNGRLDRDPSRLTTFPMPGFGSSENIKEPPASENVNHGRRPNGAEFNAPPRSTGNQYWMPDNLAKMCFDCGKPFSLFRRRHHCRLCGQIFCYECSSNFIDGQPHGFQGAIRICKFCHHFLMQNPPDSGSADRQRRSSIASAGSNQTNTNMDHGTNEGDTLSALPDHNSTFPSPSPLLLGAANVSDMLEASGATSPTAGGDNESVGGDTFSSLSEIEEATNGRKPMDLASLPTIPSSHDMSLEELNVSSSDGRERREDYMSNYLRGKTAMPGRRRSSVELLDAIEHSGLMSTEPHTARRLRRDSDGPHSFTLTDTDKLNETGHTLEERMRGVHERLRRCIQKQLSDVSETLLAANHMSMKQLASSLEDVTVTVAGHILASARFRSSNGFNYNNLVKVKSITMAENVHTNKHRTLGKDSFSNQYTLKWLAGTVCRKHMSHKSMAKPRSSPRIVLLACGISYDRSNGTGGKLSSLDTLLDQEKSYMTILVDKISALQPDILFVQGSVSRHAQELLRERGVAIVLNVKAELLKRLSRHTGAVMINSVDHVDKVNPDDVVGTCAYFTVRKVSVPVAEGGTRKNRSGSATFSQRMSNLIGISSNEDSSSGVEKVKPKTRAETYLYIDGCDPQNGCTVLLTGPDKETLRVLKRVTRDVLMKSYRMLLEAHVLGELAFDKYMKPMPKEEQMIMDNTVWCTTCTLRGRDQMSSKVHYHQCSGYQHVGIQVYSDGDISFGHFLIQEMAALRLKCQNPKCNYVMADHLHAFCSTHGVVLISFEQLPDRSKWPQKSEQDSFTDEQGMPSQPMSNSSTLYSNDSEMNLLTMISSSTDNAQTLHSASSSFVSNAEEQGNAPSVSSTSQLPTVVFWRWCRECSGVVTPFTPLSHHVHKYSFAQLLRVLLRDGDPDESVTGCPHSSRQSHVLFFNAGNNVARFEFVPTTPVRLLHSGHCISSSEQHRGRHDAEGHNTSSQSDRQAEDDDRQVVQQAVAGRLEKLNGLMENMVQLFAEKVDSIKLAVERVDAYENGLHAQVVLEVVCLRKLIESDKEAFIEKVHALEPHAADSLAACDRAQRTLYMLACRWIERLLQLRQLIQSNLGENSSSAPTRINQLSPFNVSSFTFSSDSPVGSKTLDSVDKDLFSRDSSSSAANADTPRLQLKANEKLARLRRRHSSGDLANIASDLNGSAAEPAPVSSSASTTGVHVSDSTTQLQASDKPLEKHASRAKLQDSAREPMSSWKAALWDLYRILGRSAPSSDFNVDLPDDLLAGHPSLPYKGEQVVLVNTSEPITCVAYALRSDAYEEEMDAWKLQIHRKSAATVNFESAGLFGHAPMATNWSRDAIQSQINTSFKHTITDSPLHLNMLSEANTGVTQQTTSGMSNVWEFTTIAYYPLQFEVLRKLFYGTHDQFLFSISHVNNWEASGGKSGASFYRTLDNRYIIKHISSTELQSFLDVLPSYFNYMASIYFDEVPSVLSKTVGLYQTTITKKETSQKIVHNIVVMENTFYRRRISQTYDLKGSSRSRYIKTAVQDNSSAPSTPKDGAAKKVLLDGNFLESTRGFPMGLLKSDHDYLMQAIKNDTKFLYSINIVDYSLIVGFSEMQDGDEDVREMTMGIIDYMRQFDLIKRVESVSKSMSMIAGKSSPTIIEPGLYGKRFQDAMKRYFMPVSDVDTEGT